MLGVANMGDPLRHCTVTSRLMSIVGRWRMKARLVSRAKRMAMSAIKKRLQSHLRWTWVIIKTEEWLVEGCATLITGSR